MKKWGKTTHWTYYKNLNVYCNWCVKKGLLAANPLGDVPKPKQPIQPPKALAEEEVREILSIVSNDHTKYQFTRLRNKALLACLLFTGLRKKELTNLKITDVDLRNNFIFVEHGKGDKKREIPIEQSLLKPILQEYWEYREQIGKSHIWFFNGTFQGRSKNDGKLDDSAINRFFRELSKKCNKHLYAHKMRHTFATLMLDKGADLYTLQQLMGHAKITTTTIYLSSTRKKKIEAINNLRLF